MSKLRVLIADDELPARNKMKRLLKKHDNVELIHMAENGFDALEHIQSLKPDLVFLDIEMPGMNGLEVAENIDLEDMPSVVFATAYSEHAIKAFELSAMDYLLKPFNEERLGQAIEKVIENRSDSALDKNKIAQILKSELAEDIKTPFSNKVPIPTRDRYKLVDYSEVVCIEVEERSVRLFTKEKSYLLNHTLDTFERKLPQDQFFRVNRSCIIGLKHVKEIVIWFGNRFKIILSNDKEVISSREKSKVLKQVLKF
ncbi:LytTR family DNA-binding domain-containing protein [Pontibacter sp. G13]|uniref:LytR/AlgR family response regulator transcription factor n=1 Tax=Pontibacter sp. G13 TaxID=3074898 RepID=UPI002889D617|nr:LytTR family DNA-binding domain-containing protein [Pontibacter sp. G13]WNJ16266.1 LytTR family DNA-binding domain-containing protein [Pontibacter sp. G13]